MEREPNINRPPIHRLAPVPTELRLLFSVLEEFIEICSAQLLITGKDRKRDRQGMDRVRKTKVDKCTREEEEENARKIKSLHEKNRFESLSS